MADEDAGEKLCKCHNEKYCPDRLLSAISEVTLEENAAKLKEILNNFDMEKLKKMYRKSALKHHSDKEGGDDEKMKRINASRDLLLEFLSKNDASVLKNLSDYKPNTFELPKEHSDVSMSFRNIQTDLMKKGSNDLPKIGEKTAEEISAWIKRNIAKVTSDLGPIRFLLSQSCLATANEIGIECVELEQRLREKMLPHLIRCDERDVCAELFPKILKKKNMEAAKFNPMIVELMQILNASPIDKILPILHSSRFHNLLKVALCDYFAHDDCLSRIQMLRIIQAQMMDLDGAKTLKEQFKSRKDPYFHPELMESFEMLACSNNNGSMFNNEQKQQASSSSTEALMHFNNTQMTANFSWLPAGEFHRKKAFRMLDWIPRINIGSIRVNILLQSAIQFLMASMHHKGVDSKIDEIVAFNIIKMAIDCGEKFGPDLALYAKMVSLKCLFCAKYFEENLAYELWEDSKWCTDFYPIVDMPKSNVALLREEYSTNGRIRPGLLKYFQFLIATIELIERPISNNAIQQIDSARAYYQLWEARHSHPQFFPKSEPELEQLRNKLMAHLLAKKGWTVHDINNNLNAPTLPIFTVDSNGWRNDYHELINTGTLMDMEGFRALSAFIIKRNNGQGTMSVEMAYERPEAGQKPFFTQLDVDECLQMGLDYNTFFSLDPVDRRMRFHPYQKMRFNPPHLFPSMLLQTMFKTDYWLKMLTVGSEMQFYAGDYMDLEEEESPAMHKQRPIGDEFLKIFPQEIQDAFHKYHEEQKKETKKDGNIYRFWLESLPIRLDKLTEKNDGNEETTYAFWPVRMVVRTSQMQWRNGTLQDVANQNDGMPCYAFDEENFAIMLKQIGQNGWFTEDKAFVVVQKQVEIEVPVLVHIPAGWFSEARREKQIEKRMETQFECIFWERNCGDDRSKSAPSTANKNDVQKYEPSSCQNRILAKCTIGYENEPTLFRQLNRLYKMPKNAANKIIIGGDKDEVIMEMEGEDEREEQFDAQDLEDEAEQLLFTVITELATKLNVPHDYSPEYCFAQALTKNYGLLAEAIPEFGRLAEIAKFVAVSVLLSSFENKYFLHCPYSENVVEGMMKHLPMLKRKIIMAARNENRKSWRKNLIENFSTTMGTIRMPNGRLVAKWEQREMLNDEYKLDELINEIRLGGAMKDGILAIADCLNELSYGKIAKEWAKNIDVSNVDEHWVPTAMCYGTGKIVFGGVRPFNRMINFKSFSKEDWLKYRRRRAKIFRRQGGRTQITDFAIFGTERAKGFNNIVIANAINGRKYENLISEKVKAVFKDKFHINYQKMHGKERKLDIKPICKQTGKVFNFELKYGLSHNYGEKGKQGEKDTMAASKGHHKTIVAHYKGAGMPSEAEIETITHTVLQSILAGEFVGNKPCVKIFTPNNGGLDVETVHWEKKQK